MTMVSQSDPLRMEAPGYLGYVIVPAALLDVLTDFLRYARVSAVRPPARVNPAPLIYDVITHVTRHYTGYATTTTLHRTPLY